MNPTRRALRRLWSSPAFSITAVASFALGIGALTAMYGVLHAVLLRPLPYEAAHRIGQVHGTSLVRPDSRFSLAPADFLDIQTQARSFRSMALYRGWSTALLSTRDLPVPANAARVSWRFFDVFQVRPAMGRTFTVDDDAHGAAPVAVISHAFWIQWFGSDPGAIGTSIILSGRPFVVVGVLPGSFSFQPNISVFVPLFAEAGAKESLVRGRRDGRVFVRLNDDSSFPEAAREVAIIAQRIRAEVQMAGPHFSLSIVPLHEELVGPMRRVLFFLFVAVACVLLIATLNVSGLLMARVTGARRGIAIHRALGAPSWSIGQQLLSEPLLLALAGGLVGLALASATLDVLRIMMPVKAASVSSAELSGSVLLVALVATVGAAMTAGVLPAMRAIRVSPAQVLQETGTVQLRRRHGPWPSVREAFVMLQLALTVPLLTGAALAVRHLAVLTTSRPTFALGEIVSAGLCADGSRYSDDISRAGYFERIATALRENPAIRDAALSNALPLLPTYTTTDLQLDRDERVLSVRLILATEGLFQLLDIERVQGRTITSDDRRTSRPVVVVNRALAEAITSSGRLPIGAYVRAGWNDGRQLTEVVGVVEDDGVFTPRGRNAPPTAYVPTFQDPEQCATLLVTSSAGKDNALAALQNSIKQVDPMQPLTNVRTAAEALGESTAEPRFRATLLGAFAGLALALSVVGLYGSVAQVAEERRRELAIRLALGATPARLVTVALGRVAAYVGSGVMIGMCLTLVGLWTAEGLVYGIDQGYTAPLVSVACVVGAVAVVIALIPTRRTALMDPAVTLRCG